jgi:hypothetical protein
VQSKGRNEFYGVLIKFHGCAMAQAVCRLPLTADTVALCRVVFSTSFSPVSIFHKFSTPVAILMLLRPSNEPVLLRISGGMGQKVIVTLFGLVLLLRAVGALHCHEALRW